MVQVAQTYNKPIWVTEFACGLQPNIQSLTTIMKQFLTMLDRQPLVARQVPPLLPWKAYGVEQGFPGCKARTARGMCSMGSASSQITARAPRFATVMHASLPLRGVLRRGGYLD